MVRTATLLWLLLFPLSAYASSCDKARADFERFLGGLDHACVRDFDCTGYYLRNSTCEAPVVLSRHALAPKTRVELDKHKLLLRTACPDERELDACKPARYHAACVRKACTGQRRRGSR